MTATVPHLERACEILWETGHPAIGEALQQEISDLIAERDRLAAVLVPQLVADEPAEASA